MTIKKYQQFNVTNSLTTIIILINYCLLNVQISFGQQSKNDIFSVLQDTNNHFGKVNIYQDDGIHLLVNKHIESNKKQKGIPGYRIQVYSGSGHSARRKAEEIESFFLETYPDVACYLSYYSPNFKVRVGDFRTKSEALKFKKEIALDFPNTYIIKDIIKFPEIE